MRVKILSYTKALEDPSFSDDLISDIEYQIAKSAGICYDSEVNKPFSLLKRLKQDGHFATFRFAHVTLQITALSRNCAMQNLRHKFLDFLMRSQRYCDESKFLYVIPPAIAENEEALKIYIDAMKHDRETYNKLRALNIKKEDARYHLPGSCHTEYNVVGNIQAWFDFLHGNAGRLQPAAQWEIRELAVQIDKHLHTIAPNIFNGKGEYRYWLENN